ncbi:MAG TPA: TIGR03118 family protein [Terriglobales bacterium]
MKLLSETCTKKMASVFTSAAFTFLVGLTIPAAAQHYNRIDLTTDQTAAPPPMLADTPTINPDPNLLNSWGLARSATSAWWVADNHSGVSTLYDGNGVPQQLVVTVPPPKDVTGLAAPTGVVFNATTSFEVAAGQHAIFIFATEDGTISGWNPKVNPTEAIRMVNRPGYAIYKGLALAQTAHGNRLYATNFVTGDIEVFNETFKPVRLNPFAFRNPFLIGKSNWSAFGIQNVGGNIVVTYARRKQGEDDEEHGAGFGRVAIFDTEGHFLSELQPGPWMNAPWGIALSPADFGAFSHRMLVGNFGSGNIEVFNTITGRHEGRLLNPDGSPLFIEDLWALSFGSGTTGAFNELFFTSGPNDENDGLFGKITVVSSEQRGNAE